MHILWFLPPWGWLLIVLAGVAGFVHARWVYRRTVPVATDRIRRLLVGLRTGAVTLLLLALGQPILLRLLPQSERPVVAVVVEDSASMALTDANAGTEPGVARWAASWDLAVAVGQAAAGAGPAAETVYLRGNGLRTLAVTTAAAAAAEVPGATGTDLDALLLQTRQQLLERTVRGVVVVTDGNATTGGGIGTSPVAGFDAPVWVVGVGDPVGTADRLLADLRFPEVVFQGESATVEVTVADRFASPGAAAGPATVRLRQDGTILGEATRTDSGDAQRFTLTFKPTAIGMQVYDLEVSPLANERFLANNRTTIVMDVRKDRARLLLLAARPDWDARFLAQAAASEPRLALETVYPGKGGPVLADSAAAWRAPTTVAAWQRWDGVILLGPPADLLPDVSSLIAAVRGGLGLFALTTPAAARGRDASTEVWPPALAAILPVALAGDDPETGGTFLGLAPEAGRHPILADVGGGAAAGSSLAGLPPLRGVRRAVVRDAGQALLVATDRTGSAGSGPVLVVGPAGSGRVAWFGGWELWEQAFWEPPRDLAAGEAQPFRRLLRNLLVWTALGEEPGGVSLLGRRLVYQEGEPVKIEARWLDLRGEPVTDRSLSVRLEREDGGGEGARMFSLRPDLARPGIGAADLPPLPAGRYRVTPIGGGETPVEGPSQQLVVTPASVEGTQVRQDRPFLRQLAQRVAATYVDGQDVAQRQAVVAAIADLDLAPVVRTRERRWDLWSSWPYLLVVVGLLAAEWTLRRRHGML